MNDTNKDLITKSVIAILFIVCIVVFYLIHSDENNRSSQALIVEKQIIKVRLLEIKNPPPDMYVKIQDVQTNEIFDDIFVSKLCTTYQKNESGKIMDVEKNLMFRPKDSEKYYVFDGLYDYLCTVKKENEDKDTKKSASTP